MMKLVISTMVLASATCLGFANQDKNPNPEQKDTVMGMEKIVNDHPSFERPILEKCKKKKK